LEGLLAFQAYVSRIPLGLQGLQLKLHFFQSVRDVSP